MCLTITTTDLGPADAIVCLDDSMLVLHTILEPTERAQAARSVLTLVGILQPVLSTRVICACGEDLDVSPQRAKRHLTIVRTA